MLNNRFKPLYYAAFLQGFIFWFSIEKLFMKSIGFDDKTIALGIIIVTAVTMLANTPIGILADRWSRTGILIFGSITLAVASLAGGLSNSFWTYLITLVFSGLFMASYQASYDSIVYDTLIEEKVEPKQFNKYYARLRFFDGLALILGSLVSGLIVHFLNIRAAYYLTIPFALASIVLLLIFKEPKEHKKGETEALLKHVGTTFKAVFHSQKVLLVGLNLIIISTVSSLLLGFSQLWFIALSLPVFLYGPFDGLLLSSFSLGGLLSERLKSKKTFALVGLLTLLCTFSLMFKQAYVVVVGQTIILISMVFYSILFEKVLHDNLASKIRVGSASIISTVGKIVFLPIAYLVGWISDKRSIFDVSWVVVILVVALLLVSVQIIPSQKTTE